MSKIALKLGTWPKNAKICPKNKKTSKYAYENTK